MKQKRTSAGDDDLQVNLWRSPRVLRSPVSNLGAVNVARKSYRLAESQLRQACGLLVSVLPDGHRYTAIAQVRLGSALIGQNRHRDAEQYTLAGYNSLIKHGPTVPELRSARADLIAIYDALNEKGKADEIRAQSREPG